MSLHKKSQHPGTNEKYTAQNWFIARTLTNTHKHGTPYTMDRRWFCFLPFIKCSLFFLQNKNWFQLQAKKSIKWILCWVSLCWSKNFSLVRDSRANFRWEKLWNSTNIYGSFPCFDWIVRQTFRDSGLYIIIIIKSKRMRQFFSIHFQLLVLFVWYRKSFTLSPHSM